MALLGGSTVAPPSNARLREAAVRAFSAPQVPAPRRHLADPHGDLRPVEVDGHKLMLKRRPQAAAVDEQRNASRARRRLAGAFVRGLGVLHVVVPETVPIDRHHVVLVTPHLGTPLSDDPATASSAVPEGTLAVLLGALLVRGIDFSGCVPRNLFASKGALHFIDWEDTRFGDGPLEPSLLSLMKWDIAWSDVYSRDIGLRHRFRSAPPDKDFPLDDFEEVLARWTECEEMTVVRRRGVAATLTSELHLSGLAAPSAAQLGHLADDLLGSELSVLHTLITAYARHRWGESAYRRLLEQLDAAVDQTADTAYASRQWIVQLVSAVDMLAMADRVGAIRTPNDGMSLAECAGRLSALADCRGWKAAVERAEIAEQVVSRVAAIVMATLDCPKLQLLLRGSCAQRVMSAASDVDFELSSPAYPRGHSGAEEAVVRVVECFGLEAQSSQDRPSEEDLRGRAPGITRDLHEWMELRRPGPTRHNPGWAAEYLSPTIEELVARPSLYERQKEPLTGKYLWFEARAIVARLVFRASRQPVVDLTAQLDALPSLLSDAGLAHTLRVLVEAAFEQRETETRNTIALSALAAELREIRRQLGLPGPAPRM